MGGNVAKKVWASVSDLLEKKLGQRAKQEGRSRSDLISYLLERAMENWVDDSDPNQSEDSEP